MPKPHLRAALRAFWENPAIRNSRFRTKTYASYLAALGPSLRQLDLVPTLAVYHDGGSLAHRGDTDGDEAKQPLLDLLETMLLDPEANFLDAETRTKLKTSGSLFDYAIGLSKDDRPFLRQRLEAAAVAAKLAIRTYPQKPAPIIVAQEEE